MKNIVGKDDSPHFKHSKALLIALISAGAYLNTLGFDFAWDDYRTIVGNPGLGSLAVVTDTLKHLSLMLSGESIGLVYRPLYNLCYALDAAIWGENPAGFHLTNLVLHGAVTFLVILFLFRITGSTRLSYLSGAIFGLHPIHVEPVSWISGRTDILVALFSVISILLYLKSLEDHGPRAWGIKTASLFCFILALLIKESVIILPILVLLCSYTISQGRTRSLVLRDFAIVAVIVLLYLGYRSPSLGSFYSYSLGELIPKLIFIYGEYFRLLLFPFPLKALYDLPPSSLGNPVMLRSFGMVVLGGVFAVYAYRKNAVLWIGISWIFISLLPAVALVLYESTSPLAERLLYLPSIGFVMIISQLLVKGCDWLKGRFSIRPSLFSIPLTIFLLVMFLSTIRLNSVWSNNETLWKNATIYTPRHVLSHYNLATYYQEKKQPKRAIHHYQEALNLKPTHAESHYNMGIIYLDHNQLDLAIHRFTEAIKQDGTHSNAYTNLAFAYHHKGREDLAMEFITKAIEVDPSSAVAHNNLGNLLAMQSRWEEATGHYREALSLNPDYREAQINLENAMSHTIP